MLSNNGFDWPSVTLTGAFTGTPSANHVGINKFTLKVASGEMNDVTDALLEVVHTNHAPYWVMDPIRITATEDQPFNRNISGYAADKDIPKFGDTLSFSLVSSPPGSTWLSVSDKGALSGTPGAADVGLKEYKVRVSDNHGLTADVTVVIDTKHVNHPPQWTQSPVQLPNAKEGVGYTAGVSEFATDPDPGDKLRFQKIPGSGSDWISVDKDGLVTGTPARKDVGLNRFKVRVFDLANAFSDVIVEITVEKVKHPAYWTQNPIRLPAAFEDTSFSFDLAPYAKGDGDGDPLTFEKADGPDWLIVAKDGKITGVPQHADIGKYQATFKVTNDVGGATTLGIGEVFAKNHAPVINQAALNFTVKEREVKTINLADPQYIVDKDEDKLRCAQVDTASWVKLSQSCDLVLSPKHAEVRPEPYEFRFTVADAEYTVEGKLFVTVLRDPQQPVCRQPIVFVAETNESFSAALKTYCQDLDGVPLTFEKVGTWPAWLLLSSNGDLSGKPTDIGETEQTFIARNDALSTEARFTMKVVPGTQEDKFQIDTPVVGAPTENLWVVDNSSYCSPLIRDLKKYIPAYYGALNTAGVALHHTGMMISSDAHKFDGSPIQDKKIPSDPMLMLWTLPDISRDFARRVDLAYSNGWCHNCYSSPLWSMHRLYEQSAQLPVTGNGYWMANMPMDVLIVTRQRDHYKTYTAGIPAMKNYTPEDFAREFIAFHTAIPQSYRVSAIAPECGGKANSVAEIGAGLFEISNDLAAVAPANAYKVVVDATKGWYYPTGCQFNMKAALEDYAKWVIFRAFVNANRRFTLTKKPIEISTIKVFLKGKELPGNTGGTSDKWRYLAAQNQIEIFWHLIDQGLLGPGDKITVVYRVS
jgi:hypothetical protein